MSQIKSDDQALIAFDKFLTFSDKVIHILERSDDFVVVGEDAPRAAQIVYKSQSALKKISGSLSVVTMNKSLLTNLLKEALQFKGLRIEIYSYVAGSRSNWTLSRSASPGNIDEVEDLLGSGFEQKSIIASLKIQTGSGSGRQLGVSFLDASARQIGLCQFEDSDLFTNLESLTIQLGVKEMLMVEDDDSSPDLKKVKSLLERLDVLVTQRQKNLFNTPDVKPNIMRLCGKTELELLQELDMNLAVGAAGCIIKYLGLMTHTSDYGKYSVIVHDLAQYMRLDASAMSALNIMPSQRDSAKSMSLYGILNQCKTVAGSRMLGQWLKQPLMTADEITARLDLVEMLIEQSLLRQECRELFQWVPDLSKIVRKFHRGMAKLEDVIRIYQLAVRLPDFSDLFSELSTMDVVEETYRKPIAKAAVELKKLLELVETTLDLAAIERHEYVIRADFDDGLMELKARQDKVRSTITDLHRAAGQRLNQEPDKKLKLEEHHVFGWCFRLTRTDAGCLRSASGFTELATQKAGVYFTTKDLRECNDEYIDLSAQYQKTQSALAKEVVDVTSTYTPVLGPLAETLAHLDILCSFAEVSSFAKLPYVRPQLITSEKRKLVLKQARHPCLEEQEDIVFIPNDVDLSEDTAEFGIITGPNMGGKSTYIRQVGLICLMAQIGCFVPCESAELSLVDCILARVGASDSQLRGISTFMAEMLETASILETASRKSLIIIDELGRGTSTYDGFGLAWAISQHIVENIHAFTLFATHFHELTALASTHAQVTNLHVVASSNEEDDIALLYKVEPGISDRSFGIHVAEVVNFPEKVVRMAKRKAEELEELDGSKKMSKLEIEEGDQLLKSMLSSWSAACKEKGTDLSAEEAADLLRANIKKNYQQFESQPFLKEVLSTL